ncbi:hypothetical protein D3C75_961100 [compost metagenome]
MPAQGLDTFQCLVENGKVGRTAQVSDEIEPYSPNPAGVHPRQRLVSLAAVDDCYASIAPGTAANCI